MTIYPFGSAHSLLTFVFSDIQFLFVKLLRVDNLTKYETIYDTVSGVLVLADYRTAG